MRVAGWVALRLLLICLSIDFSNPLLPGVVRMDPNESVAAVRAERARVDNPAPRLPAVTAPYQIALDPVSREPRRPALARPVARKRWAPPRSPHPARPDSSDPADQSLLLIVLS